MTGPAPAGETPAPSPRTRKPRGQARTQAAEDPTAVPADAPLGADPVAPAADVTSPAAPVRPRRAPARAASATAPGAVAEPGAVAPAAPATPPPSPAPAPAAPPRPDIAGAVDSVVAHLRGRLSPAELVAGAGALVILGLSWFLLGVVLGTFGSAPETVYLAAGGTLGLLWLRTTDAPPAWAADPRLLPAIAGAGALIGGMFAVGALRFAIAAGSFNLTQLVWWAGVALLAAGAWMSVRDRGTPTTRPDA